MNQATEQWFILGAGAIGHLFACRFAQHELSSTLITRNKYPRGIQQVEYYDECSPDKKLQNYSLNYQHAIDVQQINNLLITVKSHQIVDAILSIKHALSVNSNIYLLQNGMGNLEKVTALLQGIVPENQIYPGTNTHGAYLNSKDVIRVVHAGYGDILFGTNYLSDSKDTQNAVSLETFETLKTNLNQLNDLNLAIKFSDEIEKRLWLKLAINAVINPMTAIQRCLNGELLKSEALKTQIASLCKETASLFKKLNLGINQQEIIDEVYSVISKTSSNQSSMLQDTISGKTTEIEAICGHLLKTANQQGIEMPGHLLNYQQIKSITETINC